MSSPFEDQILGSLRRITRAIDLHSRRLAQACNLTSPQLVCLRYLATEGECTAGALARGVSLSQATITGILDRLEARGLVRRQRSAADRRQVLIELTPPGRRLASEAPSPLQDRFASQLAALPADEQARLDQVLKQVVHMMEADDLDGSPILESEDTLPPQGR
ncbi:MAG: MarR family transcriptional regulator [Myxococcales bacterium]|nr:MarR family transcriptional regulator [Myxococcales bacterium]MCB9524474.1 MarR family transcriptional regulator [Myxococcales bacterium]